jgi:hypothetical protein
MISTEEVVALVGNDEEAKQALRRPSRLIINLPKQPAEGCIPAYRRLVAKLE